MLRIAIIGGGPGGLMTAYLLEKTRKCPLDITLFEASSRLGGKIVTDRFHSSPIPYEAGAAELYDYSQLGPDPLRQLIAELGLSTQPMDGTTVILEDRILKTIDDFAREFGVDAAEALQRFHRQARAVISPAEYYESDWKEDNRDPMARRSFHDLLAAMPNAAARKYVKTLVHSDLATEPHQTNAVYGLQNYLMIEDDYMQLYTIEGGIEELPKALAKRIDARVRLNHEVVRVEKEVADEYRVTYRREGRTESDRFDFVVVALPNNWIPAVEWGGDRLADAMHKHHKHYNYPAHYLRVSILFETPFWREWIDESYFMSDAFGGCCLYDESSRGDGNEAGGVLGWLLGGDAALSLSNLGDDELIARVLDSLPTALRHGAKLFREGRVHRYVGAVNGMPGGFPMHDPKARHRPEPVEHSRLLVVGDYLFDSTLNGVLDSAEFVADAVADDIDAQLRQQAAAVPVLNVGVSAEAVARGEWRVASRLG